MLGGRRAGDVSTRVALVEMFDRACHLETISLYGTPVWQPYDLPDYHPPQPQIPARTINVPRYTVNGALRRHGGQAPVQKIDLQTTTDTGSVMTVPLDQAPKLFRFADAEAQRVERR